jgi:hypothetical protein
MYSTFNGARAFNQNVGGWNTAAVWVMQGTFANAAAFNQNVASWNVLRVAFFTTMWVGAAALSDCNKKALWHLTKFQTAWPAFSGTETCTIGGRCTTCITDGTVRSAATGWVTDEACATTTYGGIADWNTAAVSNMASLFASGDTCAAPAANRTLFNADIGGWNTSSVSNMASLFAGASAFDQCIASWSTASVESMSGMFRDAAKFNQNFGGWNVASVSDMANMFSNARSFGQNVTAWNVMRVTSLTGRLLLSPVRRCASHALQHLSSFGPCTHRMQVPSTQPPSASLLAPSMRRGARRCGAPTPLTSHFVANARPTSGVIRRREAAGSEPRLRSARRADRLR